MSDLVEPDRWRALYGAPDGRWLLVEGPCGQLYRYLSAQPAAVWLSKQPKWGNRAPRAQQQVAELLGVSQQTVSKYIDRTSELWLGPGNLAWAAFVRRWFEVASDE